MRASIISAHLTKIADGWLARITVEVFAGLNFPVELTTNAERLDAPLLAMNTQFPSDVIPPETGPEPVETVAGDKAESAPVAGAKANCET
jgi:hypothetical protein